MNIGPGVSMSNPQMPELRRYSEFPTQDNGQDLNNEPQFENITSSSMKNNHQMTMPQLHLYGEVLNNESNEKNSNTNNIGLSTSMGSDDSGMACDVSRYWEEQTYPNNEQMMMNQVSPYPVGSNYIEYKANQPFEEVVEKSFSEYKPDGTYSQQNDTSFKNVETLQPVDTDVYAMKQSETEYTITKSSPELSVESMSLGTTLANSLNLISSSNLPVSQSPLPPAYEEMPTPASIVTTPIPRTLLVPPMTPEDRDNARELTAMQSLYRDEGSHLDSKVSSNHMVNGNLDEEPLPSVNQPNDCESGQTVKRRGRQRGRSEIYDFKIKTVVVPKDKISTLSKDNSVELSNGTKSLTRPDECSRENSVILFQCDMCNKLFHRKQTLRQHFITHTDRFRCPNCDVRCKSKGDLKSHIQTHTKEKPYHCNVCNTNYTRESILRKHQTTQSHKKMEEIKKRDGRCWKNDTDLGYTSIPCKYCPKVFYTQKQLRQHIKVHSMKYRCKFCSKRCSSLPLLKIHTKIHEKKTSLSCKECSRSFQNVFLLKEHIRSHKKKIEVVHNPPSLPNPPSIRIQEPQEVIEWNDIKPRGRRPKQSKEAKWACQLCGKGYINRKSLENHENVHHKFNCNICEKKYPTLSSLKVHMKIHGKPYTCDICESPFFDQNEFKEHMDSHCRPGEELSCKICYSQFNSSAELKLHMQNHAPTMLFSGASLDESSIPIHTRRGRMKQESTTTKISDSEGSSDNEGIEEIIPRTKEDSKESLERMRLFNKEGFLEYLGNIIMDVATRPDLNDDFSDSDAEVVDAIKSIVESDMLDSPYSSEFDEVEGPIEYTKEAIIQRHSQEFNEHTEEYLEENRFLCKLCNIEYPERNLLQDHFISHVCEWCNIFFLQLEEGNIHKHQHKDMLIAKMKEEAEGLEPRLRAEMFTSDSESEEEDEEESDGFLSEMENLLDCGPIKSTQTALQVLSHEEIIRQNKRTFERYSCIDSASGIFACTLCKRKYARPTTLTRHFKTHVCHHCNEFFEDKGDLLEHKYKHKLELSGDNRKRGSMSPLVSKENRELFKKFSFVDSQHNINRCTLCCKNFVRRTVLTRHMKTHICSRCNKFYEDKYDLAKHLLEHEEDSYYVEGGQEAFVEYDADDEKPVPVSDQTKLYTIDPNFSHFTPTFHTQQTIGGDNQTLTFIQLPGTEPTEAQGSQMYTSTTPGGSTFQIISEQDTNPESFLVAPTGNRTMDSSKLMNLGGMESGKMMNLSGMDNNKMMTLGGVDNNKMLSFGGMDSSKMMTMNSVDNGKMMTIGGMDNNELMSIGGIDNNKIVPQMSLDPGKMMAMDPGKLMTLDSGKMVTLSGMDACNDKMISLGGMDNTKMIRLSNPGVDDGGQFHCGDCGKRFYKNSHLKAHMLVHASSKPFSCRLCGKSFSKETTLKKHEKIHLKRCKICDATFNYKYELDMHMEVHRTYTFYK